MRLKNKTEISAHRHELLARQAGEIAIEDPDGALLDRAQGADEAEQGRLAGTRRSRHDDELPRADLNAVAKQHLVSRFAFAVMVIEALHVNDRTSFGRC